MRVTKIVDHVGSQGCLKSVRGYLKVSYVCLPGSCCVVRVVMMMVGMMVMVGIVKVKIVLVMMVMVGIVLVMMVMVGIVLVWIVMVGIVLGMMVMVGIVLVEIVLVMMLMISVIGDNFYADGVGSGTKRGFVVKMVVVIMKMIMIVEVEMSMDLFTNKLHRQHTHPTNKQS